MNLRSDRTRSVEVGVGERDRHQRRRGVPVAALPAFLVVGTFTCAGLLGVIRTSLRQGVLGEGGWGFDAWHRVLGDPGFHDSVVLTVWVAVVSTVIAVAGSIGLAALVRRGCWTRTALALPVAAPHLVVGTVAVTWLAPGGLADRLWGSDVTTVVGDPSGWGVIAVYVAKEIPFLTLLALVAFDDATEELDDTAASLGAGWWPRLRDVLLPRLAVPMMAGGLVVTAFGIGAVEVPLLVGSTRPQMLGPYALDVVRIDGPVARADAAVAELVAALIVAGIGALLAVIAWRGARPHARRRGGGLG